VPALSEFFVPAKHLKTKMRRNEAIKSEKEEKNGNRELRKPRQARFSSGVKPVSERYAIFHHESKLFF
jgi:hypothetical protein